jgi:hypothetical protein
MLAAIDAIIWAKVDFIDLIGIKASRDLHREATA